MMKEISTERRYQKQMAEKLAFLESLTDPELTRVYRIVRDSGKALMIGLERDEWDV
jgi:hypothetical protein